MITLCTVIIRGEYEFCSVMIESVMRRCPLVREIIVADLFNEYDSYDWEKICNGVKLIRYTLDSESSMFIGTGHAIGLHSCLERATQEYVMFCDPDVFFYQNAGKLYTDLFNKYDLNIVGASCHLWDQMSYLRFPCVTNCMVKRDTLPKEDWWLNDHVGQRSSVLAVVQPVYPRPGKWLIQGMVPEVQAIFPQPNGYYDVGCNLYYWNHERNGKWISFPQSHGTAYSNFDMEPMEFGPILYHSKGSAAHRKDAIAEFRSLYNSSYEGLTQPSHMHMAPSSTD